MEDTDYEGSNSELAKNQEKKVKPTNICGKPFNLVKCTFCQARHHVGFVKGLSFVTFVPDRSALICCDISNLHSMDLFLPKFLNLQMFKS